MATTKYTYSISVDFVSASIVSLSGLYDEISGSSITSAILDYLNQTGDNVYIYFDNPLSGSDEVTLDGIVALHSGPNPTPPELDDPTLSNDVSGSLDNMTVTGIRGVTVKNETPSDGELLYYNSATNQYELVHSSSIAASGSFTPEQHKSLRQLIHFVDHGPAEGFGTGSYYDISGSLLFPDAEIWWNSPDPGKKKIVEKIYTYSGSVLTPNPITWKLYDTDGTTVLVTLTENVTYQGVLLQNITRTVS